MCESQATRLSESQTQEVRAELTRVLESSAFRTSRRCREFLEYIVDHTINGPSGTLKERSIGVELFQLPQDFDTGQHTVVRVTANEVRKKLAQHYLAENGSYHPVKITLRPGSYSADFKWEAPRQPIEAPAPAQTPGPAVVPKRPAWLSAPVVVSATAALLIIGALALWRMHAVKTITADAKSPSFSAGAANTSPIGGDLRMIAGSTNTYLDRSGRTWIPDRFFTGGNVLVRSSEKILRTLDPDIYRHLRSGDFRYDIPLASGNYELHLHFAETGLSDFISADSSGEGQRIFRVTANAKPLGVFDVVADAAGANIADERVFRNIFPAEDGFLHLSFNAMRSTAMLNAIEVLPVGAGKSRPVRIRAGWTTAWQDPTGQPWQADSYFMGGNALVRTTNPAQEVNSIAPDMALYASERWGHFSYAIPVAEGRYRVTLKFCEGHYGKKNPGGGGLGSRIFDVYCNGVALMRNFDIFKEAGGEGRPIDRIFSNVRPNAQGKILLTFVPTRGMACVNGIEVVED
jgi:Malectin domain